MLATRGKGLRAAAGGMRVRLVEVAEIFAFFLKEFPRTILLTVVAFFVASVLEAFAILSAVPLVMLIDGELDRDTTLGRTMIGAYEWAGIEPTIVSVMATIAVLVALRGILQLVAMVRIGFAAADIAASMRLRLLRALFDAGGAHLAGLSGGRLQTVLVGETQLAGEAAVASCRLLSNVIQLVIYVVVALFISWQVSLLALVIGLVAYRLLARYVEMARQASRLLADRTRALSKRFQESFSGIRAIKAIGREDLAVGMMARGSDGIRDAMRRQVLGREYRANLQEPILIGAILIGGMFLLFRLDGIETVAVLLILLERTIRRILGIQSSYEALVLSERSLESVRETMREAEAARERLHPGPVPDLAEGIVFENVSVSHASAPVLTDVSIVIRPNTLVAITGPSGAGKSTLADLVIGLVEPQAGRITIDGIPLTEVDLRGWRRRIGYVPQDGLLLHGSIAENVAFGDPEIDEAAVRAALDAAEAGAFVSALPRGMETDIGERGARLSGGQRQRILLARALAREPRLLILDEATNALDTATERDIARTLKRLSAGTTILAIAHTSSIVELSDAVIAIGNGTARLQGRDEAGESLTPPVAGARGNRARPGSGRG